MADRAIINASPLIFFSRSLRLQLLRAFADEVWVPGTEAIIDDLAGRRCAASLNIPVRGTLGVVLVAKRRGLIPEARPVIEDMMNAGLHLSRRVLDEALRRVKE